MKLNYSNWIKGAYNSQDSLSSNKVSLSDKSPTGGEPTGGAHTGRQAETKETYVPDSLRDSYDHYWRQMESYLTPKDPHG